MLQIDLRQNAYKEMTVWEKSIHGLGKKGYGRAKGNKKICVLD